MPRETRSTCPYCGVGCGVIIESDGAQITGVRGDPQHPANFGRLCSKGSTLHFTARPEVVAQTRLLQPMRRRQRGGPAEPVSWETALDEAARRMAAIVHDHGPDAVGFYVSGQLLTEDYYVFNKLAKGLVGTNNIDTNSRLCMSSAVAGYKLTLGADSPPNCYEDIDHASCLFIAGSNAAWAHPVLFRRIEEARQRNPLLKTIVVDPRRTDTASSADLHLPIQPGTDVALFNGLLHIMLWEGWTDGIYIRNHTCGFDALKDLVRDYPAQVVAELCGVPTADLVQAARWFATSPATLSLYCQGLNQSSSGTAKNAALINLHLATGQIGKPGAGPFSLTGQPNAMGGREVGGLANLLSAHRDLANPQHRAEVAALWGIGSVPQQPGKTAVEMFQAAADGAIKALWIACTNPAQSMPDQATVRRALQRAEFVVVQEAYATTATCDHADLLLPASTWGEKEGTVTNSERRISRVRAAIPPPDQARADWQIACALATRLQALGIGPAGLNLDYTDPETIWNEHRASTRGRDLDITGLSYARLEIAPQQWPCPTGQDSGRARLYEDGRFATPDGRARFALTPYQSLAEPRESRFPYALTTGRLRDQWHGMSRTGTLARLFGHVAEPSVQMNPLDMAERGLKVGDLVHVTSKRGSIVVPLQADDGLGRQQAFMAMHWGGEYLSGLSSTGTPLTGVNALTTSVNCPTSHQPELKHAAVKILKAELPWTLLAMAWLPEDSALATREALRHLMPRFAYASCVPFGRERTGVLLRAAAHEAPDAELLNTITQHLRLQAGQTLHYEDARRGQRRTVRLERRDGTATVHGFLLAGDTQAKAWLKTLLEDALPAQDFGRSLLQGGAHAPQALTPRSRQVCTCLNVNEDAIVQQLTQTHGENEQRLVALQAELKCGTQCGSCVPELRRIINLHPSAVLPA